VTVYGDDCEIAPGIIRGDKYSYLVDSKTLLMVSGPTSEHQRGVPIFFLGVSLAAAVGLWLDDRGFALMLPLLFVALMAGVSLLGISSTREMKNEWKLYVGSGDDPILIYSSTSAQAFEAKRAEIEQALLQREVH